MIRRLARAGGIDYDQWRALVVVSLKLDFRSVSFGHARARSGRALVLAIAGQIVFYTAYGAGISLLIWFAGDLFLAATLAMTYVVFMVGTLVLLDHNSALTSPNDYLVLGFRPVHSRTYFASRLANVLVYTTALTSVVVYIPVVTLFVKHGAAVGLAGLAAFSLCSLTTALGILFGYAALLRFVGPDRLKRGLSYLQMGLSFLMYGGVFVMHRFITGGALDALTLPKSGPILFYPPAWFAMYLEIGAGRTGPAELALAALAMAGLVAMVLGIGSRLSLDYSARLGGILTSSSRPAAPRAAARAAWLFRGGESRAVALLIRSQFRNDQKFRMSVLSILPLTLLYVLMGVSDAGPFADESGMARFSLVNVAVMIFPSMLNVALTRSDSFRASWVFFATPADRARVIRASKSVLAALFLAPYLLFIAVVYTFVLDQWWIVAVHVALLGLLSYNVLQIVVLLDPALPFSRPNQPMRRSGSLMIFIIVMGMTSGLMQLASRALYQHPIATALTFALLIAIGLGLDRLTRARIERQVGSLEFEG